MNITDVADAFVKAAESDINGDIFNIGSGVTYSVNDLVRYLGGPDEYIPKRSGEPDRTFADISKINHHLGWAHKMSFKNGVKKILEHIDEWCVVSVWDKDSIAEATKDRFKYLGKDK